MTTTFQKWLQKTKEFIFSMFVLMRVLVLLVICFQCFFVQAQELKTTYVKNIPLKADRFIGVDPFENYYYTIGSTLYKKTRNKTYSYNNIQLGDITTVDLSNPLKIVLFYRDFNVMILLDNRLNELSDRIDFSLESYAKNVAFISVSSNNNVWLYSLDDNILSLWNYESKKTIVDTQPLSLYETDFEATKQVSTYKYCWLISQKNMLLFNEYGSFITSIQSNVMRHIQPYRDGYLYVEGAKFYYSNIDTNAKEVLIDSPTHKINSFVTIKNNLYFFDANVLYKYTVLKK